MQKVLIITHAMRKQILANKNYVKKDVKFFKNIFFDYIVYCVVHFYVGYLTKNSFIDKIFCQNFIKLISILII